MPKGTKVDSCFQKVKKEGHSAGSAAAICQSSTGEILKTGKPINKHIKALREKYKKR